MKTKHTFFILALFATFTAQSITYKYGLYNVIDTSINFDLFPAVITNYIETSGLYSSPESLYKYADEWEKDSNAILQRFSTNVIALAKIAPTNENVSVELREMLEFLISPKSTSDHNTNSGASIIEHKKFNILIDGFCSFSDQESIPRKELFVEMTNKWNQTFNIQIVDTNYLVRIAKTMEYIKSRRHVVIIRRADQGRYGTPRFNPVETQDELRVIIDSESFTNPFTNSINLRYIPRLESDKQEEWALRPMMREIIVAEDFLYNKLRNAFTGVVTNETVCVSNLVTQVAEIADLSGKEIRELRKLTDDYKRLWDAAKSVEDE